MNASLCELQRRFAAGLDDPAAASLDPYRNTITATFRNALAATYAVVRELTGAPFFDAAVDAFARERPSAGGDLNVYGGAFAGFLSSYPYARGLAYLPDVARLEWALDEAARAADYEADPAAALESLGGAPGDAIAAYRMTLDPSCRFVHSRFPVLRIWQVHQAEGDKAVDLGAGPDHLLVRREGGAPTVARIAPADFAFLCALADDLPLGAAVERAVSVDDDFDLAAALRACLTDGSIAGLR